MNTSNTDKIENGHPVSATHIYPLAPDCGLVPITWKSAPKDPHGYYDRNNYARGWNDAVSVAQAKYGDPIYEVYVVVDGHIREWRAVSKDSYDLAGKGERRIVHIIKE